MKKNDPLHIRKFEVKIGDLGHIFALSVQAHEKTRVRAKRQGKEWRQTGGNGGENGDAAVSPERVVTSQQARQTDRQGLMGDMEGNGETTATQQVAGGRMETRQ